MQNSPKNNHLLDLNATFGSVGGKRIHTLDSVGLAFECAVERYAERGPHILYLGTEIYAVAPTPKLGI